MDRIEHWIKMGAKPSRSLAVVLKNNSVPGMEKYIDERKHKKLKKGAEAAPKESPVKQEAPAKASTEAPVKANVETPVAAVAASTETPAAESPEAPAQS